MIVLKLLLTAVVWGGTFIAGRIVAGTVEPYSAAFLRFLSAVLLLLFFTRRIEGRLPLLKQDQILPILLLGASGVFAYNVFFFKGLKLVAAGRAAVIIATNPIAIALLSAIFFKERLTMVKSAGVVLSVSGAVIVISKGNMAGLLGPAIGPGELYIFFCVLSWAAFSIIGKTVLKGMSPLAAITWSAIVGTILLFIPACLHGLLQHLRQYPVYAWLGILYLGFFGTVLGFVWYYEGIRAIGPTRASLYINFVPVSAVILAFAMLGEPLTKSLLAGTILVSLGVYLSHGNGATIKSRVRRRPGIQNGIESK